MRLSSGLSLTSEAISEYCQLLEYYTKRRMPEAIVSRHAFHLLIWRHFICFGKQVRIDVVFCRRWHCARL